MREAFNINSKKRKVENLKQAEVLVDVFYPGKGIYREGSTGHWIWFSGGAIIAEAWMHKKEGWWLKIVGDNSKSKKR